jgi:hypothetical protein
MLLMAVVCAIPGYLRSIDNAHFYKSPYLNATKSWKSKNWLSIFDAHYANGSTHRSRNSAGDSAGTFDLYGNHNLLYLTTNVPEPSPISSIIKGYVDDLEAQRINFENDNPPDKQNFGLVEFCGKCEIDEFMFNYRQNLVSNFFIELNIPIRRISNGPIRLVDKSPYSAVADTPYTQTDTDWVNFITNLEDILTTYGFCGYRSGSQRTNVADITLLGGWQKRFLKPINFLEYIKIALKLGVLFPTGARRKFTNPFSFANGYNKHLGFPVRADAIFGLSSDIYFGTYAGFIFFSSKEHDNFPIKTHATQNGLVKLYQTKIREKKGTLFDIGGYLKLDHFFKGLSALAGYSYNRRASNSLTLVNDCTQTNNTIINNDLSIKSWYQHVLHLLAQYDFGAHDFFKTRKWKPRLGLFYDHPFDGKRVIINPMVGGAFGCDLSWDF